MDAARGIEMIVPAMGVERRRLNFAPKVDRPVSSLLAFRGALPNEAEVRATSL